VIRPWLLMVLISAPLLGQEAPVSHELEPVTVTGSRGEAPRFEVSRSLDVLDRDAIERKNAKSMPDLLDELTGIHVQKTNAGAGTPFIRGLVGPENLYLLDGVRVNNSTFRTGPNQYLALFDPWSLSRVEVLRGPGSVMYGSDAMGGVIHALSLRPRALEDRAFGASARLGLASAWLGVEGSAQVDWDAGPVRGYVGGSFSRFGVQRSGGGAEAPLSDFVRASARARAEWDLSGPWRLSEALFWTAALDAGRADSLSRGDHRAYDNHDLLGYVRLERRGARLLHGLRLTASYHLTDEVARRVSCLTHDDGAVVDRAACLAADSATLGKRRRQHDRVHTPGLQAAWEARLWRGRLRSLVGLEGYLDWVGSEREDATAASDWAWEEQARGSFSDGSRYLQAGAFWTGDADLLILGPSVFNLSGGLRLSHFRAWAPDVPGHGDVTYDFTGVVGSAGLAWRLKELAHVYLDFSQGFRAPNLQETTVLEDTADFYEVPNDQLAPERSDALELGARLRLAWLTVQAAGFASWIHDAFDREAVSEADWTSLGLTMEEVGVRKVKRRVNASSGFIRGADGRVTVGPFAGISAYGSVAWILGDVDDAPARRIPPLMGVGGLRWACPRRGLFAEAYIKWAARQDRLSQGDRDDLRICEDPSRPGLLMEGASCEGTPAYATVNLRAGYAPLSGLSLHLSAENLTDLRYRTHGSGIDRPGVNVMLGMVARY
jgi:hemoglobin/transferrin/lactoferrin receptor protein